MASVHRFERRSCLFGHRALPLVASGQSAVRPWRQELGRSTYRGPSGTLAINRTEEASMSLVSEHLEQRGVPFKTMTLWGVKTRSRR
jgi:hypothetical protein